METRVRVPKCSQSAQIVASVDDLLIEILLRLPVRSLLCFKIVSKHWHALITKPDFVHLRDQKLFTPLPLGLFLPCASFHVKPRFEYIPLSPSIPPFTELEFTKDRSGVCIMQSCNGLLLCRSGRTRHNYYVYNPTTKYFTKLPQPGGQENRCRIHGLNLAFDPSKFPDYNVICIRGFTSSEGDNYLYQLALYSTKNGPWRVCSEPFTSEFDFENGVYWNNAIHWINAWNREAMLFNLDLKQLGAMPMPMPHVQESQDERHIGFFGESGDHLHLIELHEVQVRFDVYEMKRDYSGWFAKYRVDLTTITAFPGMVRKVDLHCPHVFSILGVFRGGKKQEEGDEEEGFLVMEIPGKVIRYNMMNQSFEKLKDFGDDGEAEFSVRRGFQFIESLACV